ncbi:MAG: hypothetical protein WCG25_03825 [bacterium]
MIHHHIRFFVNSFSILCLYFCISQDLPTDTEVGLIDISRLSSADINHVIKVCLASVNQSDLNLSAISGCFAI